MRRSGILMHISSLPSRYDIGKLGASAYQFADFLRLATAILRTSLFPLMPEIHISSTLNSLKNKVCSNTPITQMPTGAARTKWTTNVSIRCAFQF